MNKKIFKILQYIIFLALGSFMVWWSLKGVDIKEIIHNIGNAKILIVIIVILILLLSHWVRAIRWNLLIHSLNYYPSSWNSFFCVLIGYFANLFVPRLGEVLRCTILTKYDKVPIEKLMGTVLIERAVDFLTLIIISLITFFLQIDLIGGFFKRELLPKLISIKFSSILIIALIFIALIFLVIYLGKTNKKFQVIYNKIKIFIIGLLQGVKTIFQLKEKMKFLLYTILLWSCYLFGGWLGFKALTETSSLGLITALSCLVTGSIGMIATQGGVGAYPLLIGQTLTWYEIQETYAIAMGWLNWLVQFVVFIFAGILAWAILPIYNARREKNDVKYL